MVLSKSRPARGAMIAANELFSVRGRTALVTGGGTGLGRICAEALLSAGARVLIASRKAEACEAAAQELSSLGPCEGFGGTVANEAGVAALAAETRKRTDALHILINNAGANWGGPFETFPWKAWDRVLSVNVTGLFTLTRDLAPMLIASATRDWPSTVINMGSVMGTVTQSETAWAYSARGGRGQRPGRAGNVRRSRMSDWADVKTIPAAELAGMVGRDFVSRW